VVYKIHHEKSRTFTSLIQVLSDLKINELSIIIYDNSSKNQPFHGGQYAPLSIKYKHDERNLGISAAYNYALQEADKNGSEWLWLFDHDTHITTEFIKEVMQLQILEEQFVAVVPRINSDSKMISPVFSDNLRPLQAEKPKEGIQVKPVMAINSGALIKVRFLNEIGGFNQEFPLDYLDHWLFHEIFSRGFKVWLLHASLEHELSVMDYSRVSLERYKSILDSEINYYKNYKNELYPAYRSQLAKRLLKQVLTVKNKKIAMYTLKRFLSM
jgi:GT2 family glycosyltransferase